METLSVPPALRRAAVAAGMAAATVLAFPRPAAACVPEGALWSSDMPIEVAVRGTVVSGPDADSEWRIRIDRRYAGSLPSPFRLNFSGPCGYDTDRLVAGQRFFLVTYRDRIEPERVDTSSAFIWLLDASGNVTGELNVNAAPGSEPPHFATLTEILAGLALPDTAVAIPLGTAPPDTALEPIPPPTAPGLSGYIFLAVAIGLIVIAAKRPL
jgi:hypothetical protein